MAKPLVQIQPKRIDKALVFTALSLAMQRLTLGHSPDPDDAFMFYALAEGLIDAGDYKQYIFLFISLDVYFLM